MTYDPIISALGGSRAQEAGRNEAVAQVGTQLLSVSKLGHESYS